MVVAPAVNVGATVVGGIVTEIKLEALLIHVEEL
jgi:hypothetical protein